MEPTTIIGLLGRTVLAKGAGIAFDKVLAALRKRMIAVRIRDALSGNSQAAEICDGQPTVHVDQFGDVHLRELLTAALSDDEDAVGNYLFDEQLVTLPDTRRTLEQINSARSIVSQIVRESISAIIGDDNELQSELILQTREQQQEFPADQFERLIEQLTALQQDVATKGDLEGVVRRLDSFDDQLRQTRAEVSEPSSIGVAVLAENHRLTESERALLDADSRRRWDAIQELLAHRSFSAAIERGGEFRTWLATNGERCSAAQRGRSHVLLTHLALMSLTGDCPDEAQLQLAREHHEQARREFANECEEVDELRLLVLGAKFAFVDGDHATAVDMLAGQTEPGCVSTRLAMLLDRGEFRSAAETVTGLDPHEKWAANGIVALLHESRDSEAEAVLEWARSDADKVTLHQCLFTTASSLFQREVVDRFSEHRLSPVLIDDAARTQLERVLETLEPVLSEPRARRVETGLQADALGLATVVSHLLLRRNECRRDALLLEKFSPVHLHVARAIVRGDLTPTTDLPARLRQDHPGSFEALFLAAAIDRESNADRDEVFGAAAELVPLATSDDEKDSLSRLLHDLASGQSDRIVRARELVEQMLPGGHICLTWLQIEQHLHEQRLDDARRLLEENEDRNSAEWLQLSAHRHFLDDNAIARAGDLHRAAMLTADPDLLRLAANVTSEADQFGLMVECCETLLQLEPELHFLLNNLAIGYSELGEYQRAADCMARYCALRSGEHEAWLFRSSQHLLAGDTPQAIQVCEELFDANPDYRPALIHLAWNLRRDRRGDEAFERMHEVRDRFWDDVQFLNTYMTLAFEVEREREGHAALMRIRELQRDGLASQTVVWEFDARELHPSELLRQQADRRQRLQQALIQAEIPWTRVDGETLRSLYVGWLIRTQPTPVPDSAQARAEFSVYASNSVRLSATGEARDLVDLSAPPSGQPVVIDLSAMLTLHGLGLLDRVAGFYGEVLYPADYGEHQIRDGDALLGQQRSSRGSCEAILRAVDAQQPLIGLVNSDTTPVALVGQGNLEADIPVIGLRAIAEWLQSSGRIDLDQRTRLEEMAGDEGTVEADAAQELISSGPVELARSAFLSLYSAGCLEPLIHNADVVVSPEAVEGVRLELQGFEQRDAAVVLHRELWDTVNADGRIQSARVPLQPPAESDEADEAEPMHFTVQSVLLAEARNLPLIADDRFLHRAALGLSADNEHAASSTLDVLEEMHDCGALSDDELADAFLQLVRWRYRFLVPPHAALLHFARQFGGTCDPLREISQYAHDCMRDVGLPAGVEPTSQPMSIATHLHSTWILRLGRFVSLAWLDEAISTDAASSITPWATNECLPIPPSNVPRAGQHVLADGSCDQFMIGAIAAGSITTDRFSRVREGMEAIRDAFGMTEAEYASLITTTIYDLSDLPRAFRQHILVGAMVDDDGLFLDSRSGVLAQQLGIGVSNTAASDERSQLVLQAVADSQHPNRVDIGPGPVVVVRNEQDDWQEEASLVQYLISPNVETRRSVLDQFGEAGDWLSPLSRRMLTQLATAARSDRFDEWYPAASMIHDIVEIDWRQHLAVLRQCAFANLGQHELYLRRLLWPHCAHVVAVLGTGESLTELERQLDQLARRQNLAEACNDYMRRFGHLPLGNRLDFVRLIELWRTHNGGTNEGVWASLWEWTETRSSPLRHHHVCRTYACRPDWIPDTRRSEFCEQFARQLNSHQHDPENLSWSLYWRVLSSLTQHYFFQLELHTPEVTDDRIPCQACYVAGQVTDAVFETRDDEWIAEWVSWIEHLQNQSRFLWRIARPREVPSLARHTILHTGSPWTISLIGSLATNLASHEFEDDSFKESLIQAFTANCYLTNPYCEDDSSTTWAVGFPGPRESDSTSPEAPCSSSTDDAILEHFARFAELTESEQLVVCEQIVRRTTAGVIPASEISSRVLNDDWVARTIPTTTPNSMLMLLDTLGTVQSGGDDWFNMFLPGLLLQAAATLDIEAVQRERLIIAGVFAATSGGAVAGLRNIPDGPWQRVVADELRTWKSRAHEVIPNAPPIVQARLRNAMSSIRG